MRFLLFLPVVWLVACNSPSPKFMDGEHTPVTVAGSQFSVWRVGDQVEVLRTSPELSPSLSEVHIKAERAIELATGCRVRKGSLKGDQAITQARLAGCL